MSQDIEIERRLAAVLAADVAGFSRLTEADEVGTLRLLAAQRAILDGAIAHHRGRIANTAGDSVLAEFPSAVNAVQCAVEVQQALRDAAEAISEDRRVLFRIGIHVGDVMVRGGDLLGNGVNVAARLEGLADAGGIVLSAAAHEQVKKILPLAYTDLGAQSVKNIDEPVRAFAIGERTSASAASVLTESKPLPLPDKPSIAVLPFQNMSGDPEQEYFADGMVEDIITALSRFKSLFVIARNSSFTYKGKTIDIKQVGRELGVRYVLEGSVRKAGARVRITGQLIEAASNTHLWADKFDGVLEDVFNLQDRLTETVVAAIAPTIHGMEMKRALSARGNLHAHDLFWRAVSSFNRSADPQEALSLCRDAIELDQAFAGAHALAAASLARMNIEATTGDAEHKSVNALMHANTALSLDASDPAVMAWAGMAMIHFGDKRLAIHWLDKACAENPNLAFAWRVNGWAHVFHGSVESALECFHRALRLDPSDPRNWIALSGLSLAQYLLAQYADALLSAQRAATLAPDSPIALRSVAAPAALLDDMAQAGSAVGKLLQVDPTTTLSSLAQLFTRLGILPERTQKLLDGLRRAGIPE